MNQSHIFVDISYVDRRITAIAVVRTDHKGKEVQATFASSIDSESSLPDVIASMRKTILAPSLGGTYVVLSHYAETDRQILRENGEGDLFIGRAWLDTSQIAWPFVYHDLAGERSLETLCAYFKVSNPDPNSATGNCEALCRLYWAMMNRYKIALMGEDVVRDLGGETLQKALSFFGL